jgi:hypothetical protein
MASDLMNQCDLQALIAETEALGWDKPDFLVPHDGVLAPTDRFAFVGKLLAQRSHNTSHVRSTLLSVWSFAKPFSMEVLEPNKFLFTVSRESLFHRILELGPWTIKGSLMLLQPWSSELAIDEVKLQFCGFWVQVHDLPRQFMTTKNAIRIGMTIGDILELDNKNSSGIISRPFLRMKINLNTSLPLASGFFMPCAGSKPRWIGFQYEHLDEYCSSCGLIGHIQKFCSAPPEKRTPGKYKFCLRAAPYVRPCLMPQPQQEDSDSGVSSAASVGTSPSSFSPSRQLDPPCSSFGQLISRNQMDSHGSSNNLLSLQHVASSESLVPSQSSQLLNQWEPSSFQHPISRSHSKGNSNLISFNSKIFDWPYPSSKDAARRPYLYHFMPPTTQLAPSSSSRNNPTPSPLDFYPAGYFSSIRPHLTDLFNTFLHNWAQYPLKPSLVPNPPSPFQVGSQAAQSGPSFVKPLSSHPLDISPSRKLSTYKHSRFRPYEPSRPLHTTPHSSHSTNLLSSSILNDPQETSPFPFHTQPLFTQADPHVALSSIVSPASLQPQPTALSFEIPAIISNRKGKSKLLLNDDDLPLVQLKKSKIEKQVLVSDSSFSDVEGAALSLTKLRGDQVFKGPVHNFLKSPTLDSHGKLVDFMPPHGGGTAGRGLEFHSGGGFTSSCDTLCFPIKHVTPPAR